VEGAEVTMTGPKRFAIVLTAAVLVVTPAVQAATIGLYLGLQGGWARQKASFEGIAFDRTTTFAAGVKAGIKVFTLAVEASYYRFNQNLVPSDPLAVFPASKVTDSYLGVNVRWMLPVLFLNPYLTGGYGYTTSDFEGLESVKKGAFNVGAGLELMLGSRVGLYAEGRFQKVRLGLTQGVSGTFSADHLLLIGGFNLYF
jgi:hypothetical protein